MQSTTTMHTTRSLYSTLLEPLTRRVGLHDRVAALYWRARFARHPDTVAHEVAGTTARFHVTTVEEFRRFRGLRDERPVIEAVLDALEPGDVVFDVGANVGAYTCFLARRLPADRVVAFEPHPANLAALRANLALNDADATLVERALSDASGTGELAVDSHDAGAGEHALATGGNGPGGRGDDAVESGGSPGGSGGDASGRGDDAGGPDGNGPGCTDSRAGSPEGTADAIEIDLAAGDDLVSGGTVPSPTVLKIDVEGAELRVLEGLAETLAAGSVRLAYVEVHPDRLARYGDEPGGVAAFLSDRGFAVERVAERDDEYFLRACRD